MDITQYMPVQRQYIIVMISPCYILYNIVGRIYILAWTLTCPFCVAVGSAREKVPSSFFDGDVDSNLFVVNKD